MKYMICYDLADPESDDYEKLYEELDRLDAEPILESQWMIDIRAADANKVKRHFMKLIDKDDSLLIIPFDRRLLIRCSSSPHVTKIDKLKIPGHYL